jgi:glycerol-3-phosphate acyltransferase PlsY
VPVLAYIVVAVAAYLLGSIPTGFLVAKARGIDIRTAGSGNIGATNSMRVLGKPAGIFVLLMDCAKGFIAVIFLSWLVCFCIYSDKGDDSTLEICFNLPIIAGIFVVLGHNYTCWLKFKGGKGIATSAGVYLALAWPAVVIALTVFLIAVAVTRYVSVGSILAAIALPTAVWILQPHNLFLCIVTTALGALAIYKHKSNIQRLMAGTENRVGKKSSTVEKTK